MSERTTRLLAVIAISVALISLTVALYALRVSEDRTAEVHELREALERAARATGTEGGRPPLRLDPGEDE